MMEPESPVLTQTGPATPCGTLMRRCWQPAALSEELTCETPLPTNLLGEELILFRCDGGKPALIGRYCAHQGVDMIYGRVEEEGLRCMYHGWLFDPCGKVIVRRGWVEGGEKRMAVGQPAYPCEEVGGVIYAYLGPEHPPPAHEFVIPRTGFAPGKVLREGNYFQAIAGLDRSAARKARFIAPNLVVFPEAPTGAESRWYVPVDDGAHLEFVFPCFPVSAPNRGAPLGAARAILRAAIDASEAAAKSR